MLATHTQTNEFCVAHRGMSVDDITTELRMGKDNRRDFVVNAEVITTEKMDEKDL